MHHKTASAAWLPMVRRHLLPYSLPRSSVNAESAWGAVVRELDPPAASRSEQKSPLTIPNTDDELEGHSSVSSHPELPSSIKLSPPPGGEVSLLLKTSQKAKQMQPKHTIEGYVPRGIDPTSS